MEQCHLYDLLGLALVRYYFSQNELICSVQSSSKSQHLFENVIQKYMQPRLHIQSCKRAELED